MLSWKGPTVRFLRMCTFGDVDDSMFDVQLDKNIEEKHHGELVSQEVFLLVGFCSCQCKNVLIISQSEAENWTKDNLENISSPLLTYHHRYLALN